MNEMIKCLLVISDLFTERENYLWMLNICLDLSQSHHHEDLLLHQYVIIAAAKAMAISGLEVLLLYIHVLVINKVLTKTNIIYHY